jgi:hypothetical protein
VTGRPFTERNHRAPWRELHHGLFTVRRVKPSHQASSRAELTSLRGAQKNIESEVSRLFPAPRPSSSLPPRLVLGRDDRDLRHAESDSIARNFEFDRGRQFRRSVAQ